MARKAVKQKGKEELKLTTQTPLNQTPPNTLHASSHSLDRYLSCFFSQPHD
jgi:hypothetical protein